MSDEHVGIPSRPFGEIAEFRNGVSFSAAQMGRGTPLIGVADFQQTELHTTASLPRVELGDDLPDAALVRTNDLLFVRSNGSADLVGRVLRIRSVCEPTTHAGFTIRARLHDPEGWSEYVWQYFLSGIPLSILRRLNGGTNITNLSQDRLAELAVPDPGHETRRAICERLRHWDDCLARASRLMELKKRHVRGLMQQLLTGRRRLPAFAGEAWEELYIADIGEETAERCGDREDITVLSCTKSVGLVDSLEYFGRQVFGDDLSNYKVVHHGQFAYATNHIEEGSIGLLTHRDAGLVSPMYTVFKTNGQVDTRFLYRVLKTEHYRQKFEAWTSASVNRRGGLRWNEFSRIRIPLPSLDEQRAIADILDTAQREIELLEQLREQIQLQKRGLMQKLLTGEIRVPADEPVTEEVS